jgi:hypothetical protein
MAKLNQQSNIQASLETGFAKVLSPFQLTLGYLPNSLDMRHIIAIGMLG